MWLSLLCILQVDIANTLQHLQYSDDSCMLCTLKNATRSLMAKREVIINQWAPNLHGSLRVQSAITSSIAVILRLMSESQWPHNSMGSEITLNILFMAWHKLTKLNIVLMVRHNACGMGQWVEGGKVGWFVSMDHPPNWPTPINPPTVPPSSHWPNLQANIRTLFNSVSLYMQWKNIKCDLGIPNITGSMWFTCST